MSGGAKALAAVKAIGTLGAIWAILGLIGMLSGAIPPTIPGKSDASDAVSPDDDPATASDAGAETEADAQTDAQTEAEAEADAETDADNAEQTPATADGAVSWRASICPRASGGTGAETAALAMGTLVGDASPELVVACGAEVHVVGFVDSTPMRVARIGRSSNAAAARPRVVDVDGDGRNDLLLGHAELDAGGSPLAGELRLVLSTAEGGLLAPRVLAPISVTGIAAADQDGRPGAEIGAVHWADGHGVRPSELWLFSGGASPTRRSRVRLGNDVRGVVLADLDRDDVREWVVADDTGIRAFEADGSAGPTLELQSIREIFAADIDGDTHSEILTADDAIHRIRPTDPLASEALGGPHAVRRFRAADVDADGKIDILAVTREHIVLLRQGEDRFQEEAWITLPGTFRPHDAVLHRATNTIIVVGSSIRGWELVAVPQTRTDVPAHAAPPLADAPLVLSL